ncbi:hypothetical protein [Rhizobium sp. NFR03]|uniref:hypothetical protein n=1 Tax=Rhizobium sp. NFR03 TaxID=1566263 RepID=UPI0008B20D90|nr:hypothetical protein [Rhizobium sp. NFR03]SES46715.1 hypothetical protein SAMN03159406_04855 [Rhizobium sp. NFR03]
MQIRLAVAFIIVLTSSAAVAQEKPTVTPMPVVVSDPAPAAPAYTTKLALPTADGSRTHEYVLSDFAISVAPGMSYSGGSPRGEVSATFALAGGIDDVLLQWASQASADTQQPRKLTVTSDKPDAPKVYILDGARVIGLNLAGGSYNTMSLQVGLSGLTIDGVKMN